MVLKTTKPNNKNHNNYFFKFVDFHQKPQRLRKATLHINSPTKCLIKPNQQLQQVCCTSTIHEGKACKVNKKN